MKYKEEIEENIYNKTCSMCHKTFYSKGKVPFGICKECEIKNMKKYFDECITKDHIFEEGFTIDYIKTAKEYIEELEKEQEISNKALDVITSLLNQNTDDKQKLIEKLEIDIEGLELLHDNYIDANVLEGTYETLGRLSYAKQLLEILKGEK